MCCRTDDCVSASVRATSRAVRGRRVPHDERGPRTDEYLDALDALWYAPAPEHHGPSVDFAGIDAYPRPVQQPIPIIVGGHAKGSLRRAVTRGHGWYGFMTTPESTARCLDGLRAAADRHERPPRSARSRSP